jgi:hypothetical protein
MSHNEHESRMLHEILKAQWENNALLREAIHLLRHHPHQPAITGFVITQQGDPMSLLSISPGNSPVFTATPVPAGLTPATPPTWTSSDNTNAPITVDATGLICTVKIPTTATLQASFVLTVSYTNPDGTVATGASAPQEIVPATVVPPENDITSFTIAQTT